MNFSILIREKEKILKFINFYEILMAPRAGLEPATDRLTADCSTTELPRNTNHLLIKKRKKNK